MKGSWWLEHHHRPVWMAARTMAFAAIIMQVLMAAVFGTALRSPGNCSGPAIWKVITLSVEMDEKLDGLKDFRATLCCWVYIHWPWKGNTFVLSSSTDILFWRFSKICQGKRVGVIGENHILLLQQLLIYLDTLGVLNKDFNGLIKYAIPVSKIPASPCSLFADSLSYFLSSWSWIASDQWFSSTAKVGYTLQFVSTPPSDLLSLSLFRDHSHREVLLQELQ